MYIKNKLLMKRTITVFNQNTQEKAVFENVEVSTVNDLKSFLRSKGYTLDNMDLREGVSKTDLTNGSSTLPHDIPYKGSTTNDLLVFMTLKNKNVSSGAMSRKEAVDYMKANGLENDVKKSCGDNWTRVSTDKLVAFCEKHQKNNGGSKPAPAKPSTPSKSSSKPVGGNKAAAQTEVVSGPKGAMIALAGLLADKGLILPNEAAKIQEIARTEVGYSYEEIRDLM